MKRSEFDHAIRAAGSILGESEILVFGSQAVHGSLTDDLPGFRARGSCGSGHTARTVQVDQRPH